VILIVLIVEYIWCGGFAMASKSFPLCFFLSTPATLLFHACLILTFSHPNVLRRLSLTKTYEKVISLCGGEHQSQLMSYFVLYSAEAAAHRVASIFNCAFQHIMALLASRRRPIGGASLSVIIRYMFNLSRLLPRSRDEIATVITCSLTTLSDQRLVAIFNLEVKYFGEEILSKSREKWVFA
jgi:hypothetical protein